MGTQAQQGKNMASIEKRGPHQYRVIIKRKGFKRITRTFPTKKTAREWGEKVEADMKLGTYVDRTEAESFSLHEALQRYIDEHIPRLKHPKQERNRAKAIQKRKLADMSLAAITPQDIADYFRDRETNDKVSANTIRLDLAVISGTYVTAIQEWGMHYLTNPVRLSRKPKLPPGRTRRLNSDEEKKLLGKAVPQLKPVIEFALETAMRRSEIANLDWTNVDFKGKTLFLATTKNKESRTVPLSPRAIEILKEFPRNISGSVFGYRPDSISQAFAAAAQKAELKNLRFHDLRHEATSRLFERTDLDVMEIRMITGHKTMQMLARYAHLRADRIAERLAGVARGETS